MEEQRIIEVQLNLADVQNLLVGWWALGPLLKEMSPGVCEKQVGPELVQSLAIAAFSAGRLKDALEGMLKSGVIKEEEVIAALKTSFKDAFEDMHKTMGGNLGLSELSSGEPQEGD